MSRPNYSLPREIVYPLQTRTDRLLSAQGGVPPAPTPDRENRGAMMLAALDHPCDEIGLQRRAISMWSTAELHRDRAARRAHLRGLA